MYWPVKYLAVNRWRRVTLHNCWYKSHTGMTPDPSSTCEGAGHKRLIHDCLLTTQAFCKPIPCIVPLATFCQASSIIGCQSLTGLLANYPIIITTTTNWGSSCSSALSSWQTTHLWEGTLLKVFSCVALWRLSSVHWHEQTNIKQPSSPTP